MPHINSRGGGDDLASTDEVKVYNDEGAEEIEQRSSEKFLSEDKLGLVKETEQDKSTVSAGRGGFPAAANKSSGGGSEDKSIGPPPATDHINHIGYFYRPYANGTASLAASGKVPAVGFQPHPGLMTYGDIMTQPPPAHSGIQVVPAMHIGYKAGLPRSSIYPIPASSQYSMYPEFVPAWPGAAGYAMPPVGGFHAAAPYMHYMAAAAVAGGLLPPPHPSLSPHSPIGLPQSALIGQGLKQDSPLQHNIYDAAAVAAAAATRFSSNSLGNGSSGGASSSSSDQPAHGGGSRSHPDGSSTNQMGSSSSVGTPGQPSASEKKARVHIKKPLNAFMLFMKEMRSSVVSECTLKESAAINQILGRKWHQLDRAQQAKYYDMAKKEREQHMKLYPGWSARDNYAMHSKKKKKQHVKEAGRGGGSGPVATASASSSQGACNAGIAAGLDGGDAGKECQHPKKCRARFGLDKQSHWCKPCRRKKKCVIQHLSDAQVCSSANGSGEGYFDNSDNDVSTEDAADTYHSQASANDLDDSNDDDLVMDHDDDDDVHDVDDDSHENRGDADGRLATHMHKLSTQRGRALVPAFAAGSAAAANIDRTNKDTSAGAIMQEQGQEL